MEEVLGHDVLDEEPGRAGGPALARPDGRFGTASGRLGATAALTAGPAGLALGGLVAVTADGGLGTGNGLGGALVAMVLGLTATVLGRLALTRSRRANTPASRG